MVGGDRVLILDYIKSKKLCALATVDGKQPEAAIIQFLPTDKLEFVFETLGTNRKVKNLLKNQNVAAVFGGEDKKTVQYEGVASKIGPKEFEQYKGTYLAKYPTSDKWINHKDILFFRVTPKWIRYYDSNQSPTHIFEVDEF